MQNGAGNQDLSNTEVERLRARVAKLERISRNLAHVDGENVAEDHAWREWERTFDAAKDSIIIVDPEFKIVQANVATSRLLDIPIDGIVGKTCWEVVHDSHQPPAECPLKKAYQSRHHEEVELYIPEKHIWVEASVSPILDNAGNITSVVHILRDITARKRAEEALRKSEQEIRLIADNVPGLFSYVGADEQYRFVNKQYEEWFGLPAVQIVGRHCREVLGDRAYDKIQPHIRKVLSGEEVQFEDELAYQQGGFRWVKAHYVPDVDDAGQVKGFFALVTDITEHRKAQEEIKALARFPAENPNPVLRVTADGVVVYANAASELLLQHWGCQAGQQLPERWHRVVVDALSSNENKNVEFKCGERICSATITPVVEAGYVNIYGFDITDRKRMERLVRKERDRAQKYLDVAAVILVAIDSEQRVGMINNKGCEILGYNEDEIIGKNWFDNFLPRRVRHNVKEIFQSIMSGQTQAYEYTENVVLTKTGQECIIAWHNTVLRDDAGEIIGTLSSGEDVTERKRAVDALCESERKLKTLFEILPVGVSILDAERKMVYVNPALERIMDISREGLLKGEHKSRRYLRPDGSLMPAEEFASVRAIKEQRAVHNVETGVVKEDGNIVWTDVSAVPVAFPDWKVVIVTSNITERKRAEEALRESEERFRRLYEQAPLGYQSLDAEGCFIDVNQAWIDLLGYSRDQVIGHWFGDFLAPQEVDVFKQRFPRFKATGEVHADLEMVQRTGSTIIVHIDGRIAHDEYGQFKQTHCILHDITAKKRAEEELKKSAQLLSDTGEMAKVGGWELDLSTKEVVCTEETCRIHGIEPGYKLSLEEALNFYAPESIPPLKATLKKTAETGEPYDLESLFIPSGSRDKIWVRSLGRAVYSGGKIVKLTGTFQNIDKYKRAEEALRQSEEKFARAFHASPNLMSITTLEGRIIDANEAYCALSGYSREELVGKSVFEFNVWADTEERRRMVEQVQQEGSAYNLQVKLRTKSGEIRLLLFSAEMITFGGEPCLINVATDITERKLAEDALRESEQKYRELFENARETIVIIDLDKRITDTNKFVEEYGFRREDLIGKNYLDFLAEEYREKAIEDFEQLRHGVPLEGEFRVITPKGYVTVHYKDNPMVRGGNVLGVQSVLTDVTERKKAEEELLNYQAKLKALASELTLSEERQRQQIATDIHDRVSQPLAISKMKLDGLCAARRDKKLKEEIKSICESLGQTIAEMRSLTFDLSSPILHQLGLEQALREYLIEHIEGKHGIHTEFEDDGQPKPLDNDVRSLLFRDVRELLVNVVKHAGANEVRVSVRRDGSMICITVKDDGVGFDPVAASSRAGETGCFGLFSIRERLEELGGQLQIDSSPGHGCKVTMTTPLKRKETTGGRNKTTRKGKRN
jgi:PAS domain S-box-containing protein